MPSPCHVDSRPDTVIAMPSPCHVDWRPDTVLAMPSPCHVAWRPDGEAQSLSRPVETGALAVA